METRSAVLQECGSRRSHRAIALRVNLTRRRRLKLFLPFIKTEQCSSRSEITPLRLIVRQLTVFGGATTVGVITPTKSFTSAVISRPDYLPENRNPAGP